MRVAAGVLLIVMAAANLFGGMLYAAGGGMMGLGSEAMEKAAEEAARQEEQQGAGDSEALDAPSGDSADTVNASAGTEPGDEPASQGGMTPEEKREFEQGMQQMKGVGAGLAAFGLFLIVLGGLEIAGGVLLFKAIKAAFVLVVAGLQGLASVIAMAAVWQTISIPAILGLIVAGLAVVAARSYSASTSPVAEGSATPE